jgi:hypothetical protein
MKIHRQAAAKYQGRPAEITRYLRSTSRGERLVVTHWLDTDTYSASHVTGAPRYQKVPGSVVGRLVPGSMTTIATYADGDITPDAVAQITREW